MTYGVTATGFKKKRYEDILTETETKCKELFGSNIGLDGTLPLGKFNRIVAWFGAELWEMGESIYHAISVETASGIQLDRLVKYKGISRISADYATGQITITGVDGTPIAAGFIVAKGTGEMFVTTEDVTIASGTAVANIVAMQVGKAYNADAGQINVIVSGISGVTAVENADSVSGGLDEESDHELLSRYAVTTGGSSTIIAIKSALWKVSGLLGCEVYENTATTADSDGRPGKSFEAITSGGANGDIAKAIFDSKPAGIQPYGTQTVVVTDDAGVDHDVKFTPATVVPIALNYTINVNKFFPSDGVVQLKDALIAYIGGTDSAGLLHAGADIGEDTDYGRCLSIAYGILGVKSASCVLSKKTPLNLQASTVAIAYNQVADILLGDIGVTVNYV